MEEMRKQAYFSGSGTRRGYQSSLVATVRLNPLGLVPSIMFPDRKTSFLDFFHSNTHILRNFRFERPFTCEVYKDVQV